MRLATAFVEISVRMETYRKQLKEAQEMASAAARTISGTLRGAGELSIGSPRRDLPRFPKPTIAPQPGSGVDRDALEHRSSETLPRNRRRGGSSFLGPPLPTTAPAAGSTESVPTFGFPEQRNRRPIGPAGAGTAAFTGGEEKALLREQVELGKKELAILNKQLKALQEVRQGIPAVLT